MILFSARNPHIVLLLLVVICTAFFLVAAAPFQTAPPGADPAPSNLLPAVLVVAITALVNYVVTAGLKSLSAALPGISNLTGYGTSISAALTGGALLWLSGVWSQLPPDLQSPIGVIAAYLITLFLSYGLHGLISKFYPLPATVPREPATGVYFDAKSPSPVTYTGTLPHR